MTGNGAEVFNGKDVGRRLNIVHLQNVHDRTNNLRIAKLPAEERLQPDKVILSEPQHGCHDEVDDHSVKNTIDKNSWSCCNVAS